MIGYSIGANVMLQLGSFQFGINTAAYQDLSRRSEFRWPSQDLFGVEPNLQFTGPSSETSTLSGVIYTEYRGGIGQLDALRRLGKQGTPLPLVGGSGAMLGRWVIESVEERQETFAGAGYPRKQEFTLQLKKYPGAVPGASQARIAAVRSAAAVVSAAAAPAPNTVPGAKSALGKMVDTAQTNIASTTKSMTSTLADLKASAVSAYSTAQVTVAKVQQGISTARQLQAQLQNVKDSFTDLNSLANIQSAVYSVMTASSAATNAGAAAAGSAKALGAAMDSPALAGVVQGCQTACGRAAVAASGVYSDGVKLLASMTE